MIFPSIESDHFALNGRGPIQKVSCRSSSYLDSRPIQQNVTCASSTHTNQWSQPTMQPALRHIGYSPSDPMGKKRFGTYTQNDKYRGRKSSRSNFFYLFPGDVERDAYVIHLLILEGVVFTQKMKGKEIKKKFSPYNRQNQPITLDKQLRAWDFISCIVITSFFTVDIYCMVLLLLFISLVYKKMRSSFRSVLEYNNLKQTKLL